MIKIHNNQAVSKKIMGDPEKDMRGLKLPAASLRGTYLLYLQSIEGERRAFDNDIIR